MRAFPVVVLSALVLLACSDAIAPDEVQQPTQAQVETAVANVQGGAWIVINDDDTCLAFPSIGPNGEIILVFNVPCKTRLIDTQNGNGNAHVVFRADVPNESGRAVAIRPDEPICSFLTASGVVFTAKAQFTISASGNLKGTCHIPE